MIRTFTGYRPSPPQEYVEKGITNGGLTDTATRSTAP